MSEVEDIRRIISGCKYCDMATVDGDRPRVRPVSAFLQDDMTILIAAFAKSRKMAELARNPNVELCYVDGGHNQVRVSGTAEVIDDVAVKRDVMENNLPREMWEKFFSGPEDPNFGLVRIVPERFEWNSSGEVGYRTYTP